MYEACFETIETIVILSKGLNSIKCKKVSEYDQEIPQSLSAPSNEIQA